MVHLINEYKKFIYRPTSNNSYTMHLDAGYLIAVLRRNFERIYKFIGLFERI